LDFTLDNEQRMLADALERWTADQSLAGKSRMSTGQAWSYLAQMGLFGLTLPASVGGMGLGPGELVLAMKALGPAVLEGPVAPTMVAAHLLGRGGSSSQRERWLDALLSGRLKVAVALEEPDSHHDPFHVTTRLDAGRLSGLKSVVQGGDEAQLFLVSFAGPSGVQIAMVERAAQGVHVLAWPALDCGGSAQIRFEDTPVEAGDVLPASGDLLDEALDFGRTALCAEAAGLMRALLDSVLDHLRTREQFKQPLGRFQALQHRAVELLIIVEHAHSLALMAAAGLGAADPSARRRAVSTAKAQIGVGARRLSEESIQLFGGIGMTQELHATRMVKRLLAIDMTWGDSAFHLDRYLSERDFNDPVPTP